MNFLFAAGVSLATAALTILMLVVVLTAIEASLGKKLFNKTKPAMILFALITMVTFFNNAQTYGPRLELDKTALPDNPDVQAVEVNKPLVEPVDRRGMFEDRIESEPVK